MKKMALFFFIVFVYLSCGKTHPTGFRIKPPGERYISSYQTMQLVGNFQNWNIDDPNSYMVLVDDYKWQKDENIRWAGQIQFKFVPDHHWDPSFGTSGADTGLAGYVELVSGLGTEIALNLPEPGIWRFYFDERSLFYRLERIEGFSGAILGRVVFSDVEYPPYPVATLKLCNMGYEVIKTSFTDSLSGDFGFYSLPPDSYVVIISALSYISETLIVAVSYDSLNLGNIVLQRSPVRQPPEIDGVNDFLATDLIAVDPTGDMTERNLDLDSLWGVFVGDMLYIGFNAYASVGFELSYGLYISFDTTRSSSASRDPWNRNVRASFGMPEFALYVWHTGSGTFDEAQLCEWNGLWVYNQLTAIGGLQAYRAENHFFEIKIPVVALGSPDSVFVELFTTGAENSHAQDTSPNDPNVSFVVPDWRTDITTTLSRFVLIKR